MEALYTLIWGDITKSLTALMVLLLLWTLWMLHTHFSDILSLITRKKQYKTEKDIKNHQFFKDLQYRSEHPPICMIADVDKGKLIIATDLLQIQYKVAYECFKKWLVEDFSEWTIDTLKERITHTLQQIHAGQWEECKNIGIPDAFLKKFSTVNQLNQSYINQNITSLIQSSLPLSVIDKIYITLNYLSTYYDLLITDMPKTVLSLNGDLRGLVYKNFVLGAIDGITKKYLPPDISYTPKVEIILEDLIHRCKASRARVIAFHDYKKTVFDGMFSVVYEAACPGVRKGTCDINYKYTSMISDIIHSISSKQMFEKKVEDCILEFKHLLSKDGSEFIVAYPIINNNQITGFLMVEWLSYYLYERMEIRKLKKCIVEGCMSVAPYLYYSNTSTSAA